MNTEENMFTLCLGYGAPMGCNKQPVDLPKVPVTLTKFMDRFAGVIDFAGVLGLA